MKLRERSTQKELLDEDGIRTEHLWRNLYELDVINKYLGGHQNTIGAIKRIISTNENRVWRIVDLGCGGGDTLRAIAKYFNKRSVQIELTGIDILPDAISYSRKHTSELSIEYICADFAEVEGEGYDIAISSLFCHHLYGEQFANMIETKRRLAKYLVINDLHRHFLAYHSIKLLTQLFSKSHLVKNDAPLSVACGFRKAELENMLSTHDWSSLKVYWGWAFRWIVIAERR